MGKKRDVEVCLRSAVERQNETLSLRKPCASMERASDFAQSTKPVLSRLGPPQPPRVTPFLEGLTLTATALSLFSASHPATCDCSDRCQVLSPS